MPPVVLTSGVSGVILAGGKSRRMGGFPKALIPFGGRSLIEHIAETLRSVLSDCLVVTNTPDLYASLGLPMVGDIFPESGSLGGIYSGLRAAPGDHALCVACDMPFVSAPLAGHLASRAAEGDVVIPDTGGKLQTLHAVYGKACLPAMERRLRAGRFTVADVLDDVRVVRVSAGEVARFADPDVTFTNLNTPEDLARARALWSRRPAGAARGSWSPSAGGDGAGG